MIAPQPTLHRPKAAEVHVLFFGKLADRFGRVRDVAVPAAGCTVGDLKRRLAEQVEGGTVLAEASIRAAVEQHLALNDDAPVRPGQEVAFLPAFSGG